MTLALYGKSRSRQVSLAFVALLAIAAGIVGGLWAATTAFAHHNTYDPDRQCDASWSASANYVGGGSTVLLLLVDVKINNEAYAPGWTGSQVFTAVAGTGPTTVAGRTVNLPAGTKYYWSGQNGGFNLFNRSGGAGTFNDSASAWGGELRLYYTGSNNSWSYNSGDSESVYKPGAPSDCEDLTVTKTNNVNGILSLPGNFTWKMEIRNIGSSRATFETNEVIFRDNLPTNNGLAYSNLQVSNQGMDASEFGDMTCSLSSAVITCKVRSDRQDVKIDAGDGFDVTVVATPTSAGTYANPKSGGVCKVDPDGKVTESNEGNNTCADTVVGDPPKFTVTAEKVVCDSEQYLPNWAGSGAVTAQRVADFVAANSDHCAYARDWVFEIHPTAGVDQPRPGDNDGDVAAYTNFTGSIQLPADGEHRIREQFVDGYVPFTGVGGSNVSAEFYCGDDVANYDNLEWAGPADTYCVAFNALNTREVEVCKVVIGNGDQDVDGGEFIFEWRLPGQNPGDDAKFSLNASEPAGDTSNGAEGKADCTIVELPNSTVEIFEWGTRPNDWNGDDAAYPQNSQSNQHPNGTASVPVGVEKVTFFNKTLPRTGEVIIEKYVWNGDAWVKYTDGAPFSFDISDKSGLAHNDVVAGGPYTVLAGSVKVSENLPVEGYSFVNIFEGVEGCPADPFPQSGIVLAENETIVDVEPGDTDIVCAYNEPMGRLIINKIDNTTDGGTFNFDIDANGGDFDTASGSNGKVYDKFVPLGSYSVAEVGVGSFAECEVPNPNGEGIYHINPVPTQVIDEPGETIIFNITNEDCPVVAGTGTLIVEKHLDIDGIPAAGDPLLQWTVTVSGPEFPGGQQFVLNGTGSSPAVGVLVLPGIKTGPYTVTEASAGGYTQTGLVVNAIPQGVNVSAGVTVAYNETEKVEFYNQPLGSIRVDKVTLEAGSPINERGGWAITVKGCGIERAGVTSGAGTVVFNNLPACAAGYTVSENAASKAGFVATSGSVRNNVVVTLGGTTEVQFINERTCTSNCGTVTPTPTPTTPPSETPETETPEAETPTPVDTVAGDITPGPTGNGGNVLSTPIAPNTGTGTSGAASPMAVILLVIGLAAISGGATILAVARRR